MNTPNRYQVTIAAPQNLNIILTNESYKYSYLISGREAAEFTNILEQTLAVGQYSNLDKCPFCGKAFERQNRLCLLDDGVIVHRTCYRFAIRHNILAPEECKEYMYRHFPRDTPLFDYTNLDDRKRKDEFRYAIQIVSKAVIHLRLIAPGDYKRRRVCLTYDECLGLITDIRNKLSELERLEAIV